MENFISLRDRIVVSYRNHEKIAQYVLKFIVGLILFAGINSLGHFREGFEFAGGFMWTLGLSAIYAIAPPTASFIIILLAAMIQISLSLELTLVVFLLGACILIFYCRLFPGRSFIIIAMILGFYFRMPYLVVLLAGLYAGLAAIVPVAIGTAVWSFLPVFSGLAADGSPQTDMAVFDVIQATDSLAQIYTSVYDRLTTDFWWLFSAFIFAMAIVIVYAISRLSMNYAKELALCLGGALCFFGVFVSAGDTGPPVILQIIFILLSTALALGISFFNTPLDYKKIENVSFEDEENYYYVKVVKKLVSPEGAASKAAPPPRRKRVADREAGAVRSAARSGGRNVRAREPDFDDEFDIEHLPRPRPRPISGESQRPSPRPRPPEPREAARIARENAQRRRAPQNALQNAPQSRDADEVLRPRPRPRPRTDTGNITRR